MLQLEYIGIPNMEGLHCKFVTILHFITNFVGILFVFMLAELEKEESGASLTNQDGFSWRLLTLCLQ